MRGGKVSFFPNIPPFKGSVTIFFNVLSFSSSSDYRIFKMSKLKDFY